MHSASRICWPAEDAEASWQASPIAGEEQGRTWSSDVSVSTTATLAGPAACLLLSHPGESGIQHLRLILV